MIEFPAPVRGERNAERLVTFITNNALLVHEITRDYYVQVRLMVSTPADIPVVFQHHRHRREHDALVINLGEYPGLEGIPTPDFAPVVLLGAERGSLPMDATADQVAQALGLMRRPRRGVLVFSVVSSNVGGCSKTTTCLNLARLASADGKTLVIEADLDGRLRYILPSDIPRSAPGLFDICEALQEGKQHRIGDFVQHVRGVDFLLAPSGVHENLMSVVDAEALAYVIQEARTQYDNIFVEFASIPYGTELAFMHTDAVVVAIKAEPGAVENLHKFVFQLGRIKDLVQRMAAVALVHSNDDDLLNEMPIPLVGQIPFDPTMDAIRCEREIAVDLPKRVPKVAAEMRQTYERLRKFARDNSSDVAEMPPLERVA